jgi:hypothetical protein
MKNTFVKNFIYLATFAAFSLAFQTVGFAQNQGVNCPSCSCGGSIIAGGCKSGPCCPPLHAFCECYFYSTYCGCDNKVSPKSALPKIHRKNILELSNMFDTDQFTSTESNTLAQNLPLLIQFHDERKPVEFYELAKQLDLTTRRLPASEKQVLNNWIASKGGDTVFE